MALLYNIFNSSLFKASGIYTITSIINSAIPFLLLPILTRYLSPEDYGIVSMFGVLTSIIGVFTGLSVHGAINRVYFEKSINFKEYVANCIIILFFSSLITFIAVFIFLDYIAKISGIPKNWVLIGVMLSFFQFVILVNLVIYQAQLKPKEYSIIQLSQTLINVILSLCFVIILAMRWEGRLLGQLIATMFVGFICFFILFNKWTEWKINTNYILNALKFGIPLIPHTIGGMLMAVSNRFIINNILGIEATGIFTVGLQIGMIIGLFADAFNRAYAPWLFGKLNQNNDLIKLKIVKFTYIYFVLIILFAIILGLTAPLFIKFLVGKDFRQSADVILWIALGNAFNGMYYMVTNYIFYVYKTQLLTWVTFVSGIINMPLTILLTKQNGIVGASQSYALTLLLFFILTWILSAKVYKMPWGLKL